MTDGRRVANTIRTATAVGLRLCGCACVWAESTQRAARRRDGRHRPGQWLACWSGRANTLLATGRWSNSQGLMTEASHESMRVNQRKRSACFCPGQTQLPEPPEY
ncbi:hypothetical protein BCV70DRAFT_98590 [Testicularia cyperi]|uniref:Secreted protein n=1 Tax=Testicularia cyperi TaxID=1882483 RepID=A0A317XQU9_9BASI|nr:hypothetical protein BCV70DRAFT_98590 [Testicularia cyperi]